MQWGSSTQIRGELAVFSGLNMMFDVHICIFKNTIIITNTQVLISNMYKYAGVHNLCHPAIRDGSTWSKFGARGEHGDVFLFSNLGAL